MRLSDTGLDLIRDGEFDALGLLGTNALGFLTHEKYADRVRGPVIAARRAAGFVPSQYGVAVNPGPPPYPNYDFGTVWGARYLRDVEIIEEPSDDPESTFWGLPTRLVRGGFYPRP